MWVHRCACEQHIPGQGSPASHRDQQPFLVTWAASGVSCGQSGPGAGPQGPVVCPGLRPLLPPPGLARSPRGGRRPLMLEWLEEQES